MKWNPALKDYKHYLKLERGLSSNSIASYALDIKKLIVFLEEGDYKVSPISIKKETIQEFIYSISKQVNARSQSRIISGLRSYLIT